MLNTLKNLYVKLGGALTDTYAAIAGGKPVSDYIMKTDVISACAEKAGSGGGGGGVLIVNLEENNNEYIADKTPAEIYEAWQNDVLVALKYGDLITFLDIAAESVSDDYVLAFVPLTFFDGTSLYTLTINYRGSAEGWIVTESEIELTNGAFILTLTENDGSYTANKTPAEIYAAWQAGTPCYISVTIADTPVRVPILFAAEDNGAYMIHSVSYLGDASLTISYSGSSWDVDIKDIEGLPLISSANNGQVLTAVGGDWKAEALPDFRVAFVYANNGIETIHTSAYANAIFAALINGSALISLPMEKALNADYVQLQIIEVKTVGSGAEMTVLYPDGNGGVELLTLTASSMNDWFAVQIT